MFLAVILFLQGCAPKPVIKPTTDDYGCSQPPPDVFTSAGVDLKFAQSTFPKVITGDINIKTNPQVLTLTSKAAKDDQIRSYLRCLSMKRDGYTPEQAAHLDYLSLFMQTNPDAEQFLSWQRDNPFPHSAKPKMNLEKKYSFDFDNQPLSWAVKQINRRASEANILLHKDLISGTVETKRFSLHLDGSTLKEILDAFCINAEVDVKLFWHQQGKNIFIEPR